MEHNREPRIDPQKYAQLIFDKDAKVIQWKIVNLFNKWCWGTNTGTTQPKYCVLYNN